MDFHTLGRICTLSKRSSSFSLTHAAQEKSLRGRRKQRAINFMTPWPAPAPHTLQQKTHKNPGRAHMFAARVFFTHAPVSLITSCTQRCRNLFAARLLLFWPALAYAKKVKQIAAISLYYEKTWTGKLSCESLTISEIMKENINHIHIHKSWV